LLVNLFESYGDTRTYEHQPETRLFVYYLLTITSAYYGREVLSWRP